MNYPAGADAHLKFIDEQVVIQEEREKDAWAHTESDVYYLNKYLGGTDISQHAYQMLLEQPEFSIVRQAVVNWLLGRRGAPCGG